MEFTDDNYTQYVIRPAYGHFEIWIHGELYCTADSMSETIEEVEKAIYGPKNGSEGV